MKTATSLVALATMAVAAPVQANDQTEEKTPPTAESAKQFVEETEKKMFDFSVDAARTYWINSTYINEDTDALAAKVGAEGTTMSVNAAIEAAQFQNVPGIDRVVSRKLDKLRGGIVLPAPATPGAAKELNEIATKLNSAYGKGKGTLKGKPINGFRHRGGNGHQSQPR